MVFRTVTRSSDFSFLDTVKTNQKYIQNIFQGFFSPMNAFFVWMVQLTSKMWGFRGTERPSEGHRSFMHRPSVMVWCVIGKEKVIGPSFFENENVNGENYRNIQLNNAFPRFVSLWRDYIFHQDGASPHYSNRFRTIWIVRDLVTGLGDEDLLNGLRDLRT